MKIAHINVNHLTKERLIELAILIFTFNLDIICLNETFLKPKKRFLFKGYKIFRFDRPGTTDGGGVAILVREGISVADLGGRDIDGVDIQKVEVQLTGNKKLRVAAVYCPPDKLITDDVIDYLRADRGIVICGDLNAKHMDLGTRGTPNLNGEKVLGMIGQLNLKMLSKGEHTYTTRLGNKESLDIFLASEDVARLVRGVEVLPDIGSDHLPISIEFRGGGPVTYAYPAIRLNLDKANWDGFIQELARIVELLDFEHLTTEKAIDEAISQLESALMTAQKNNIPVCKAENLKPWRLTRDIKAAIDDRRSARRFWELVKTTDAKRDYNRACKLVKTLIAKARLERFKKRCDELSNLLHEKPRLFWKEFHYLSNNAKASQARVFPPIDSDGKTSYSDQEKADAFAEHLANNVWVSPDDPDFCAGTVDYVDRILRKNAADLSPSSKPRRDTSGRWTVKVQDTIGMVKRLKGTAPGDDGIMNATLKKAPAVFWEKATAIFNGCIRLGYMPAKWKVAIITLIPKEGKDWRSPKGYRPISLLNSMPKILERLVARRVLQELVARKIIPESQSAFRTEHTVEDHSFRIAQLAAAGIILGEVTILCCLDVEGAFDRIWMDGLRFKLINFGFPAIAIGWISDFLRNRTFRVRVGNSESTVKNITGGVPQGSPLSPILYTLYTADIPREVPKDILQGIYADDLALAKRHADEGKAISKVNEGLEKVRQWFRRWRLKVNAQKSQALRISLKRKAPIRALMFGGQPIAWAKCIKYLGVHIDRKLLWKEHVKQALGKAASRLAAIRCVSRRQYGINAQGSLMIYKAYMRPVLIFGSPAWCGVNEGRWEKLEIAQNKALRLALRLPPWSNCEATRSLANMSTLKSFTLDFAANWLSRAIAAQNLAGREAEAALPTARLDDSYLGCKRPPLVAIKRHLANL